MRKREREKRETEEQRKKEKRIKEKKRKRKKNYLQVIKAGLFSDEEEVAGVGSRFDVDLRRVVMEWAVGEVGLRRVVGTVVMDRYYYLYCCIIISEE